MPTNRLTPHQREVYDRIVRFTRNRPHVTAANIGSRMACEHLAEKGYIAIVALRPGPRGGERIAYRVTA